MGSAKSEPECFSVSFISASRVSFVASITLVENRSLLSCPMTLAIHGRIAQISEELGAGMLQTTNSVYQREASPGSLCISLSVYYLKEKPLDVPKYVFLKNFLQDYQRQVITEGIVHVLKSTILSG